MKRRVEQLLLVAAPGVGALVLGALVLGALVLGALAPRAGVLSIERALAQDAPAADEAPPAADPPRQRVIPPPPPPDDAPAQLAPPAAETPDSATLPEAHRPTLSVRVSPESGIATGDVVQYELTVEVPDGDDVNLPRQSFEPFELFDQHHTESLSDGRRRFVFTLELLALEPGELTVPALTVRVITADGVVGRVSTDPQRVTVGSLVANEPDAQPRPATEPLVVMQDDYTLAYLLGALALVALGALLAWLFLRWWRRRPKELPPPPPPRPAHEVALERLHALRRQLQGALAKGEQAYVVDGASDALREYLGQRYGFNGLESTTDEVIAKMREHRQPTIPLAEIIALLGECDLVKFAKAVPDQAACERVIDSAEGMVRRTMFAQVTPPPPPPPAPSLLAPPPPDVDRAPRPIPMTLPPASPPATIPDTPAPVASEPAPRIPTTLVPETPIPVTPVPPAPRAELAAPAAADASEEATAEASEEASEEATWSALEAAVIDDELVVGELSARREDGWLVALGPGVFATLPEAHLGGIVGSVGERHAFRVVSLHAGKKRVLVSHRDVDANRERTLLGRETPIGVFDPSEGSR